MIQYDLIPYKHISYNWEVLEWSSSICPPVVQLPEPRKFCPSLFIDCLHVWTPKSLTTDPLWLGDIGVVLSAKTEGDNSVPPAFAKVGRNMWKNIDLGRIRTQQLQIWSPMLYWLCHCDWSHICLCGWFWFDTVCEMRPCGLRPIKMLHCRLMRQPHSNPLADKPPSLTFNSHSHSSNSPLQLYNRAC